MVDTYFDISAILPALQQRQLVLTANNRLRNHMLRAYATWSATQGDQVSPNQVWPSPRIYSLTQWFEACWQQLLRKAYAPACRTIINPFQRQLLWENIIQQSSLAAGLLQPEPLAQAADSALRNLELWQLGDEDIRTAEPIVNMQSNSYCFLAWLAEFRAKLARQAFITQEAAYGILIDAIRATILPVEPVIWLQGFDDIPPLHQDLINSACHELKISNVHIDYATTLQRTECSNSEEEIRAAALWSKAQLEHHATAMIGIIVPNLGQCRNQVERIFTEVFEPLAMLPTVKRYTLPFNFSAGTPLASTPIIAATIALLDLQKSSWDLEHICHLLQSPFFGTSAASTTDSETVARAHLIEQLRKLGKFIITASDLRYHSQRVYKKLQLDTSDNNLATRLLQLEHNRRQTMGKKTAAYWCDFFQQHLQSLGWPGARRLDSQEHQQLVLWNQVMENFLQLDNCGMTFTYPQAVQQLRTIAGKTPFQAQTPHSPIQILGALEGAGLQFSHCWVIGLHHRQWPPVPAPNPLLPTHLQRTYKMPHADTERELLFARALTQHYRQCAAQVVFSSAHSDEESELSPSALIRPIALTPLAELIHEQHSCAQENVQRLVAAKKFAVVATALAPVLALGEEPVRGGAGLLKEQAACPFNAFARLRLGARMADAPVAGFSPIERGNMLHEALANLWRTLTTQAQLLALGDVELQQLIRTNAQAVIDRVKQKRGASVGNFYCALEHERLSRLLQEWLEQEKYRPPFTVIAIEQDISIQYAGLPLTLRIDRIDELANGQRLLIDYKTGQPSARSWLGERPDEPQLPLYALTANEGVAAIAFAQINAKAMQWIGTGELQVAHPGIVAIEWQQQLQEWQSVLSRLAQDFMRGDARVDFKDQKAQDYAAELMPLNRILEADAIAQFLHAQQHGEFL